MKLNLRSESSVVVLRTLLAVAVGFALWFVSSLALEKRLYEEQRAKHLSELAPYGASLSLTVNTRLALANSLEAFVHTDLQDPELKSKFLTFAAGLYAGSSGVRAIQLFPPEGLELVYPLRTNEKVAIGGLKSLLADDRPEVVADLAHAIQTRNLSLSGPYELKQGGLGLVARKAIFHGEEFWGFAVIVLDMPPLLDLAGVEPAASSDMVLALKDDKGKVFSGDPGIFDSNPVTMEIVLPEHEWILAAIPAGGWQNTYATTLSWFKLLGFLAAALAAVLVYVASSHGSQLRNAVRKATTELRENEVNLESRVAARTAELEAANRDLESFSYSVSHDLRAPLRAISGFSHILAEEYTGALDAEGVRLCGIIGSNAEKMGSLIDNLLEFSRLGRTDLSMGAVDMSDLARSVFEELTTAEGRARIDFTVSSLPKADADSVLMRQVWMNLISNAIKFSGGRDRPVIRIDSEIADGKIWYRISDNGAGFDMKYADKLFGVFQRLHGQKEFEGTGVGLAIVKKIIVRHGGEIVAEARPNEGARFSFYLPESH